MAGKLTIQDTTMRQHRGPWTNVSSGQRHQRRDRRRHQRKSITITNSTVQGVP